MEKNFQRNVLESLYDLHREVYQSEDVSAAVECEMANESSIKEERLMDTLAVHIVTFAHKFVYFQRFPSKTWTARWMKI